MNMQIVVLNDLMCNISPQTHLLSLNPPKFSPRNQKQKIPAPLSAGINNSLIVNKKDSHFQLPLWAENETRTRDPDLGKVVLYQLSYFRIEGANISFFSIS